MHVDHVPPRYVAQNYKHPKKTFGQLIKDRKNHFVFLHANAITRKTHEKGNKIEIGGDWAKIERYRNGRMLFWSAEGKKCTVVSEEERKSGREVGE